MDGFNRDKMLDYLKKMTGLSANIFERINIKAAYSFIDIKSPNMPGVLDTFENEVYKGRKIRVDSSGRGGTNPKRPKSSSKGKKRFFKRPSRKRSKNPKYN